MKNKPTSSAILQLVLLLILTLFITMDQSYGVNANNNNNKRLELACLTTSPCLEGLCLGKHCSNSISTQHKNDNDRNGINEILSNQLPTTATNLPSTEGQMTFSNPAIADYGNNSNCEATPIASITVNNPTINDDNKNIPVNTIDNNLETKWSVKSFGTYLQLNLHSLKKVCSIDIAWDKGDKYENNFMISTSKDGKTFTDVLKGTASGSNKQFENYDIIPQVDAKYVKITLYDRSGQDNNGSNNDNSVKISEVRINTVNTAASI